MRQFSKTTAIFLSAVSILTSGITIAGEANSQAIPGWVTRMKIKGDIRARFENVTKDKSTKKSRFRERVRIGIYGDVNEQMDWGFRIASGSDESPTSSNQSLDDFSGKRKIWMDLGYFGYRPAELDSLHIIIGKFKKPWHGVSDLVWDGDLNPEGINAAYGTKSINTQLGYYIMKDNATGNNPSTDTGMFAGQLDSKIELFDHIKLTAGIAGFLYQNIKDTEVVKSDSGKYMIKGNSVTKTEDAEGNKTEFWANDYKEVDTFVNLDINRGFVPLKVYGEYVLNVAADSPDDNGWKVGIKASFLNKKLSIDYNYRDLGRDAVLGLLTDSDFGGGGTGSKGHKVKVKYAVLKNCTIGLTSLLADNQIKDANINTIQADIVVKF